MAPPPQHDASAGVDSRVSSPPEHAIRPLKDTGRQSVWLIQRPGQEPRVLKIWRLTPVLLVKLALGIAQPQRQIAGARRLVRARIRTSRVIAGWRFGRRLGWPVVELELAYVAGRSALDLVRDGQLAEVQQRRASASIGTVVAELISAGLFNRDLKLSNLIVDDDAAAWLIDTVAVRPMRRRAAESARMLERLAIQVFPLRIFDCPAVWVPVLRRALRAIPERSRREVVRWLRAHRRR